MDIRSAIRPQFNKKRKPNWSENEISFLLREFEKHKIILTSKLCGETTSQQKRQVWKLICDGLNARNPYVKRTTEEVRRKWKNLLSASKRELVESKRPYIEGGPPPRPISSISRRVIKLRGTVRQQSYAHPGDQNHPNVNYHGLPTMVEVVHHSNHIDSDDLDDLDDNLDDMDQDDFDTVEEHSPNGKILRLSPKKENHPSSNASITENKYSPIYEEENHKEHVSLRMDRQNQEVTNDSRLSESEVLPRIHGNDTHRDAHAGLVQDDGESHEHNQQSNGLSSRSSSPFSDVTTSRHITAADMYHPVLPSDGYPRIFTTNGFRPEYAMYDRTDGSLARPTTTTSERLLDVDENGESVAEIQADMVRIQRDKLKLEKEVLELYKERMTLEVEWWRNRLQRTKTTQT